MDHRRRRAGIARRWAVVAAVVILAGACASGGAGPSPPAAAPMPAAEPSTARTPTTSAETSTTTSAASTTEPSTPDPPSTTARPTTTTVAPTLPPIPAEPVAVAVPAIELSSPLQHVGLQADDGGVEVPADFAVAGWYRGGGRPGGPGPTVLVGHVDSRAGPAVFYRLGDLRPGDVVEVTVADGSVARYAVTGTEQFPKAEFPSFAVFGATVEDVVRLVTCTGEFNRSIRSYYDNLVVTATRLADG